jgi:uncharacterized membrane protein YdjX (TVP38/TMEM64 family)
VLEVVRHPVAYFFAMIAVFSVASLPPSPPTLMAAKANAPWLLATLGAAAAAVAAVLDYYLIRRVFRIGALDRARGHRLFAQAERWAKVAPFLTIVVFAALPLPFMIPRVLMPLGGYPLPRYAAASAVGRFPRVFVLAAFGQIVDVPSWMLEALFAGGLALAALGALARHLGWIRDPSPVEAATDPQPPVPVPTASGVSAPKPAPPPPPPPS